LQTAEIGAKPPFAPISYDRFEITGWALRRSVRVDSSHRIDGLSHSVTKIGAVATGLPDPQPRYGGRG
jgi:hypothetical protein